MDVTSGTLLSIRPGELRFPCELGVEVPTSVRVENVSAKPVAFKVKTNAPKKYFTKPSSGIISPHGNTTVTVTMNPQQGILPGVDLKDKFLLQSVIVSSKLSESDLPVNLKELGEVSEIRLAVVFLENDHASKHDTSGNSLHTSTFLKEETASSPDSDAGRISHNISEKPAPVQQFETAKKSEEDGHGKLDLVELHRALGASEEMVGKVKTELAALTDAKEEVEKDKLRVQQELAVTTEKLVNLQKKVDEDALELFSLQSSLAESELKNAEVLPNLQEKATSLSLLSKKLEELQAALSASEEMVVKKEKEMTNMRVEAEQDAQRKANVAVFSLRSELASTRSQSEQLLSQLEEMEKKRWEESKKFRELQEKLTSLEQRGEGKQEEKQDGGEGKQEEKQDDGLLQGRVEALEGELIEAQSTIEALQVELAEAKEQVTSMDASHSAMEVERNERSMECVRLHVELEAAEEKTRMLEESTKTKSVSSSKIKQVEDMATREAQRAERLRRELAIVKVETQEAREAIDELKSAAEKFLEEKLSLEEILAQVEISDVRHNLKHTLKLMPYASNGSYTQGTFTCSACFKYGNGWVWECSTENCDYHLHLSCPAMNKGVDPRAVGGNV